jgi:hypothetical protein
MLDRYQKLHDQIKDRTPDRVFAYFGAKPSLGHKEVQKIYDEYARSNDPQQLPKGSPEELIKLCKTCFDIVSNAKDILLDDKRRVELFERLKSESANRLRKSKELTAIGLELLRKGQFQSALEKLQEAEDSQATAMQFFIKVWAQIKAGTVSEKPALQKIYDKLESMPMDDRRTAYYFMALGLVKKALGDASAGACFERVLQLDSSFSEAKRELNSIAAVKESKKVDIFTGDITEIVSQLFRRKAEEPRLTPRSAPLAYGYFAVKRIQAHAARAGWGDFAKTACVRSGKRWTVAPARRSPWTQAIP